MSQKNVRERVGERMRVMENKRKKKIKFGEK